MITSPHCNHIKDGNRHGGKQHIQTDDDAHFDRRGRHRRRRFCADGSRFGSPPTVILVHGAFAGSSSWNGVISDLAAHGYPVIAVANPPRGLKTDADYVARVVESVPGPVVLVGHSYGGEVITVAGTGARKVKALVYVAGLAPDSGESAAGLGERFPGGTLGQALAPPVLQADGTG